MVNNISTLGQSLNQIARLKTQQSAMADLTAQISSGKKTQKLSGLGTDIIKSIQSRAGINSLDTYMNNITHANRRLNLMQSGISEIKAQAGNIADSITLSVQQGEYPDFDVVQNLARNIQEFIIEIINRSDGERYLFAGGDTSEPPITDTGLFKSFLGQYVPDETDLTNPPQIMSGAVGAWGNGDISTEEFIAAFNATSDTVLGFSNALTTDTAGKTTVRVNDNSEFDYTTLANKTAIKDIIMVLGVLQSLPPVEHAPGALNDPAATALPDDVAPFPPKEKQENFFKVINELGSTLNNALSNLDKELFRLSQVQAQITLVKDSHNQQIHAYRDIIGETEDVDITEASARILQMNVQMEASFQVTALVSRLTLANYL